MSKKSIRALLAAMVFVLSTAQNAIAVDPPSLLNFSAEWDGPDVVVSCTYQLHADGAFMTLSHGDPESTLPPTAFYVDSNDSSGQKIYGVTRTPAVFSQWVFLQVIDNEGGLLEQWVEVQ